MLHARGKTSYVPRHEQTLGHTTLSPVKLNYNYTARRQIIDNGEEFRGP
jgi:hypothetical protein